MKWTNAPKNAIMQPNDVCAFNFCVSRGDPSCSEDMNTCGVKFCITRYCWVKDGCIKF